MLSRLSIRDIVLIDRLDLAFASGVVTLTGETGAGKSILLDALGLALGGRSDASLLRAGTAQAVVTAVFDLDAGHPACRLAEQQGISLDGELILRRVVSPDGRSRAFVNDQPCAVGTLRQLGALLVEVHGQFDTQALFDPAMHRGALDEFAGLTGSAAEVASAHAAWRAAAAAEAKAREEALRAAQDEAFLRHATAELEALDPKTDEERTLAEQRALLAGGEKLGQAVRAALDELGAHKGVEGALRAAQRQLERLKAPAGGRIDPALAALERAAVEAADAIAEVEALAAHLDHDPAALERAEERLFALKAAARKHRVAVDDLAALRNGFLERLAALDDGGARLEQLAAAARGARDAFAEAAKTLGAARRAAAARLDKAVMAELPPLKLDKAVFRTRVEALAEPEWNAAGTERVVFEVATNAGGEPGPLAKIASGGELARFMLALKAVMARAGAAATLVFDEVDSGVGGATAAAVGERLARLGTTRQVLVVTHSPQVAARGTQHLRVAKRTVQGRATTTVETLDGESRREEVARMLSGATITDAARAAAQELLAGPPARGKRSPRP